MRAMAGLTKMLADELAVKRSSGTFGSNLSLHGGLVVGQWHSSQKCIPSHLYFVQLPQSISPSQIQGFGIHFLPHLISPGQQGFGGTVQLKHSQTGQQEPSLTTNVSFS